MRELWYFIRVYSFREYNCFLPDGLDLWVRIILWEQWDLELWYSFWQDLSAVTNPFDLDVWPIFKKKITLDITSLWQILEFLYCIWAFFVTISSYWYQDICSSDLNTIFGIGHYRRHLCFTNFFQNLMQ